MISDYILVFFCMLLVATLCMTITFFIILKRNRRNQDIIGTLIVSTDDPDGAYIFLELGVLPEELTKRSQVVLKIKHLKPNSQK